MCGIACAVSLDKTKLEIQKIQPMIRCIHHRGPDMDGLKSYMGETVVLGHKRLSILDRSTFGIQPMKLDGSKHSMIFNGEIYNFKVLKEEALSKSINYLSNTDTEVVLHMYQAYGKEMTNHLNGMWAFIILDEENDQLFASRDRVGMKPLYYYQSDTRLYLASEIKSILAVEDYKPTIDLEALNEYFTFQNIISNRTLFKNIKMLMPGHNLIYDFKTNQLEIEQYWDLTFEENHRLDMESAKVQLNQKIDQAVARHMMSDVPLGVTLSGGLDSSTIVAKASSINPQLETFTGYFETTHIEEDDRSNNEYEDALKVATLFGLENYATEIKPEDVLGTIHELVWHLEDPRVGMSYTFLLISRFLSERVTVNLSGTGGDEVFAGYPWRYSLIEDVNDFETFNTIYYDNWSRITKDEEKSNLFTKEALKGMDLSLPFKEFSKLTQKAESYTPINRALYFDFKTFLHGFLVVEDKLGMASSIETRFPFLDHDVIEFASTIPSQFKFHKGESKVILKEMAKDYLPTDLVHKKKQGFTPPDYSWYKNILWQEIYETLLGENASITQYVNKDYIDNVMNELKEGKDQRMIIWNFLFTEIWLKTFVNHESKCHM